MTIVQSLNLALSHHGAGRLVEAEGLYRQILAVDPEQPDALHWLGFLAHQAGHGEAALQLIARSLSWAPHVANYHNNLGQVLATQKRNAAPAFRNAISLNPELPEAYINFGGVLTSAGSAETAIDLLRRAVTLVPATAEAHNGLALALKAGRRFSEAISEFRRALTLAPFQAAVASNLGGLLWVHGDKTAAEVVLQRALIMDPGMAEALANLATVLLARNNRAARLVATRAVRVNAALATGFGVEFLKQLSQDRSQTDLAVVAADATRYFTTAVQINPASPEEINSLGVLAFYRSHFDQALRFYDRALALRPDYAVVHWQRSFVSLLRGDLAGGWPPHEWRLRAPELKGAVPPLTAPRWAGEDLTDQTILLHAEQGLGDTLHFLRYIPLVAARGGRVVLVVQRSLVALLKGFPGIAELIPIGDPLPPFDLWLPLLSLPLVFGTTLETIPGTSPYLRADPEAVALWHRRLGNGIRVGLVWAGNPGHANDRNRSCPLEALASLLAVPEIRWFSLQKGPGVADLTRLGWQDRLIDLDPVISDFGDTAAIVANLDLLISVDTSVVHLAGALGRPCWVLLPFVPDWRWMLDRVDSPWYPTLRLFRQIRPGDWATPVSAMIDRLRIDGQSATCKGISSCEENS
ncbi:MAG: tetratricopeptide repeat protein [Acidobacteriaceae bacterium]|nr:tetratricopeptide repeat protein [Acidobacteriaceae bacterium]